jgi:hypothetical protein
VTAYLLVKICIHELAKQPEGTYSIEILSWLVPLIYCGIASDTDVRNDVEFAGAANWSARSRVLDRLPRIPDTVAKDMDARQLVKIEEIVATNTNTLKPFRSKEPTLEV